MHRHRYGTHGAKENQTRYAWKDDIIKKD